MSRVLVISDVHLMPWIFDMADRVDADSYDSNEDPYGNHRSSKATKRSS